MGDYISYGLGKNLSWKEKFLLLETFMFSFFPKSVHMSACLCECMGTSSREENTECFSHPHMEKTFAQQDYVNNFKKKCHICLHLYLFLIPLSTQSVLVNNLCLVLFRNTVFQLQSWKSSWKVILSFPWPPRLIYLKFYF